MHPYITTRFTEADYQIKEFIEMQPKTRYNKDKICLESDSVVWFLTNYI